MIGDDPEGHVLLLAGAISLPGQGFNPGDHRPQQVAVEIALDPWITAQRRSRPMPVSMLGLAGGSDARQPCGYTA